MSNNCLTDELMTHFVVKLLREFSRLALFTLIPGAMLSQTALCAPLTIRDAFQMALQSNPTVEKAREKVSESDSNYRSAITHIGPTLTGVGEATYKKDSLFLTNALFGGEPYNLYSLGLQLTQPIFNGGAMWSGLSLTHKARMISELDLHIAERDVGLNVIQAFYQTLLNERRLEVILETERVQRKYLKTGEQRFRVGREQQIAILGIRTNLALLAPQILQSRNDLSFAAADLARVLSKVDGHELQLTGSLSPPEWTTLSARETLKYGSGRNPPDIERANLVVAQSSDNRSFTLAKYWPQVNAVGYLNSGATEKTKLLDQDGRSWAIGVQVAIPLFNSFASIYDRRALVAQQKEAEADEVATRDAIANAVLKNEKQIELSQNILKVSLTALKLARQAADVARRTYPLGTTTYLQLFDAERNWLNAELAYNSASYDYIIAMAKYFNSVGWPLSDLIAAMAAGSQF